VALLRLLPLLLLFACTKANDDVYAILNQSEHAEVRALTHTEIAVNLRMLPPTYDAGDLLGLLAEFGQVDPDLVPMWNNFFQDGNCNTAQWTYLSDGVPTWIIEGDTLYTQDLIFQTWSPSGMPLCEGYIPPCNGGHDCRVEVDYLGARFAREAIGWALVNNAILPPCELGAADVEPSTNYWDGEIMVFEPYEFMIQSALEYDLDGDHDVDMDDLFLLLAAYE
jgi:hypothetical protein